MNKIVAAIVTVIALLAIVYGFSKIAKSNAPKSAVDAIVKEVVNADGSAVKAAKSGVTAVAAKGAQATNTVRIAKTKAETVAKRAGSVPSGQKAGDSITVTSLDMVTGNAGGWVAIQELDGTILKNILGVTRVNAGMHKNIVIKLLRGTVVGNTYAIAHYADDGDRVFDVKKDRAVLENDGTQTMSTFVAK